MSAHTKPTDVNLLSGDFWGRNSHDELSWLRANAPVYWDEASNLWGITRYDHVKEIETNPAVFSNANGVRPEAGATPMLIDLDDPAHKRRRQLVAEGFTPRRVRGGSRMIPPADATASPTGSAPPWATAAQATAS